MTSIARHYTARFVHPSSLPHRPTSTIHAYSNQNQITVQFFRSPRSKAGYGFLLRADWENAPRFRPKTGTRGQELAKIAAVGLAIGLALALCASFAKYGYELTAFCLMTVNLFCYLLSLLLSSYS